MRVTLHARPVCEHVASGSGGDGGAEPSRARCLSGPECAGHGTRPRRVTGKGTSRGQKGRKPGGQPWVWVPVDPFLKGKMI